MKALIVYDSYFGNTEQIARAIGAGLGSAHDAEVVRAGDLQPDHLKDVTLLGVGSPTRAFRPTPAMVAFLKSLPDGSLSGVSVFAFDTRIGLEKMPKILTFLARIFGYAAEPMANRLTRKGGRLAAPPSGFFVLGSEGPLQEGEIERAGALARTLVATH